jgi:hypothetical protein
MANGDYSSQMVDITWDEVGELTAALNTIAPDRGGTQHQ